MARGAFGSTMNAPSRPSPTCFAALWWEWYMCDPALGTVNSYVYVSPGFTGGWVMYGTPSWSFGTSRPWKWMHVDSDSLLVRTTRTRSPSFTRISGPGTWALYAMAGTLWPGATSQ